MEDIIEKQLLDEIASIGYKRPTLSTLHYAEQPLQPDVVEIILKWLSQLYEEHVGSGEFLVRALVYTRQPFSPSVLLELFENSKLNTTLKQTLAHVLSIAKLDIDLSSYIKKQLISKDASFSRVGFLSAIEKNANFKSREELMAFF